VPRRTGNGLNPCAFSAITAVFVELLRLAPVPRFPAPAYREVHAFNLEGSRQICTGELVAPATMSTSRPAYRQLEGVGDVPLVVLVMVSGAVEYLARQ